MGQQSSNCSELNKQWRNFDWGQKEALKKHLKEFSVSDPDVNDIKILVAGEIGAGKSSFINSINNVFQGRITASALVDSAAGDSHSFTKRLKSHRIRCGKISLPFIFMDVMGLEPAILAGSQTEDIINAVFGHVKDGYKFNQEKSLSCNDQDYKAEPTLSDKAFCLVYIIDATTIQFIDDHLIDKLKVIRRKISDKGIPQVIVLTKIDEACPLVKIDLKKVYFSKKIKEKMEFCRDALGVPLCNIFPVKNYCDEIDTNEIVDVLILKALDQIVHLADDRLVDETLY